MAMDSPDGPGRRTVLRRLLLPAVAMAATRGAVARADPDAPIRDAHAHLVHSISDAGTIDQAVSEALRRMSARNVQSTLLAPPAFSPDQTLRYGLEELRAVADGHKRRFGFLAGGESLNPLLQRTPADAVPDEVRADFLRQAEAIAISGAAGFGELAAERFASGRAGDARQSSPADHPLLLALADFAAKQGMPIALHMQAVAQDMPLPADQGGSGDDKATLKQNIGGLEGLLQHNRQARIVWLHAGWDLTGERSVALMRGLLERHPNLFLSLKSDQRGAPFTAPLVAGGTIKPGWLTMLSDFPGRFVIGTDQYYDDKPEQLDRARTLIDALPADLAQAVGRDNVAHIYRLPAGLA
jgi:hypothetical protein